MKRPGYTFYLLLLGALGTGLLGCDSSGLEDTEPPAPLSAEAFSVETFGEMQKRGAAGEHLTAAVLRYVPVSATLGATYLLIPKLLTEAALEQTPQLIDDEWVWSATPGNGPIELTFRLGGRVIGTHVDWTMRISGNNLYTGKVDEFVLYTARTAVDGSSGTWELYYKHEDQTINVLDAEFTIDSPTEKQITFSVPVDAPNYPGYVVRYERDGDLRIFYWYQPDVEQEHTLAWNPVLGIGWIESTDYKDGGRYCWNSNGEDVACS